MPRFPHKQLLFRRYTGFERFDKIYFEAHRDEWAKDTCFTYPGAIQYFGPSSVCDVTTRTLALEKE